MARRREDEHRRMIAQNARHAGRRLPMHPVRTYARTSRCRHPAGGRVCSGWRDRAPQLLPCRRPGRSRHAHLGIGTLPAACVRAQRRSRALTRSPPDIEDLREISIGDDMACSSGQTYVQPAGQDTHS
ncbi:hypothetical protein GUJ93_ZPchr0008g12967 [Zizania palustris]|uniref:Uncharacterized protein n=1 Tax=Zizania palustris TaxID=103762 RepID=A0A8J5RNN4_ZIZPA|nr:hypothetical protein GUJ93_ZPchr0008g12967 [Zizania palustris]